MSSLEYDGTKARELAFYDVLNCIDLLEEFDREKRQERKKYKRNLAESLLAAIEVDLSLSEIAKKIGKSRQSLNRIIVDVFGVRHEDKANAARLGHKYGKKKRGTSKESETPKIQQ